LLPFCFSKAGEKTRQKNNGRVFLIKGGRKRTQKMCEGMGKPSKRAM